MVGDRVTITDYQRDAVGYAADFPTEYALGEQSAKRVPAAFRKQAFKLAVWQLTHKNGRHNKNGLGDADYARTQGFADYLERIIK